MPSFYSEKVVNYAFKELYKSWKLNSQNDFEGYKYLLWASEGGMASCRQLYESTSDYCSKDQGTKCT